MFLIKQKLKNVYPKCNIILWQFSSQMTSTKHLFKMLWCSSWQLCKSVNYWYAEESVITCTPEEWAQTDISTVFFYTLLPWMKLTVFWILSHGQKEARPCPYQKGNSSSIMKRYSWWGSMRFSEDRSISFLRSHRD